MTAKAEILSRFGGTGGDRPLYLPDLGLWYDWHCTRGTLPAAWMDLSLPEVARAMGVAIWLPFAPWRTESRGVDIETTEGHGERVIRWHTSSGTLVARWTLGPDGDWWQVEYPVKTAEDLRGVVEIAAARTYVVDAAGLGPWMESVGDDGILAVEIPRRPYSDLLHQFLGWGEGLLFLRDAAVDEINSILETKLQRLVEDIAKLPGEVVFSPDNLDGQFISPKAFRTYLADSYRLTAEALHQTGKRLVVHIGGPIGRLLGPLAEAGVAGFEGIAGPPQGDLGLAEARERIGSGPVLWGGVPQDFLLGTHEQDEFEAVVKRAAGEAQGDGGMLLGIADRVPVAAELSRLEATRDLVLRLRDELPRSWAS